MSSTHCWQYLMTVLAYSLNTVCVCVNSEDEEEAMCQDTDSDVADQKDCGKVKVKWTQEEVFLLMKTSIYHNIIC